MFLFVLNIVSCPDVGGEYRRLSTLTMQNSSYCLLGTLEQDFGTDRFADEHYFQNYVNRHYSPHAKSLVLKYQNDLKAAAGPASSLPIAPPRVDNRTRPEPIRVPSHGSVQATSRSKASGSWRYNDGAAIRMPEAPMPLVQAQNAPSAIDILCDAALASQKTDSLAVNGGDPQDKGMIGDSRQQGRRDSAVVNEDADDTSAASRPSGSGFKSPAQREVQKMQRDQRRTRKAAHRHAQSSDLEPETAASHTHSPPSGPPHVQTGHYSSPIMYGPPPACFGFQYGMQPGQPGYPPPQNPNAFQPHNNGFYPYGGPPQVGGAPGYNVHPPFGYGGLSPQYPVPYMGGYYIPGYVHNNGQGYGNGFAYMDGGMENRESMDGQDDGVHPSSGPGEEDTQVGDRK